MVKPKIIIHLGTFKTGSSSIQNTLWTNRDLLKTQSVLYPESGILTSEPEIGFRHSLLVYPYKRNTNLWQDKVSKLIQEINDSSCDKVIISSEAWSRSSEMASLKALLEKLKAAGFDDFSAVCYFRNQEKYARSYYRESVRRRDTKIKFDEYLTTNKKIYDYVFLARKFNNVFKHKVKYGVFDESDNIVIDFFNHLEIDTENFLSNQFSSLSNRGLNAIEIELCRLFNAQGKSPKKGGFNFELIINKMCELINKDQFIEKSNKNIFIASDIWKKKLSFQTGFSSEQVDKLTKVNKELANKMDVGTLTEIFTTLINNNTTDKH